MFDQEHFKSSPVNLSVFVPINQVSPDNTTINHLCCPETHHSLSTHLFLCSSWLMRKRLWWWQRWRNWWHCANNCRWGPRLPCRARLPPSRRYPYYACVSLLFLFVCLCVYVYTIINGWLVFALWLFCLVDIKLVTSHRTDFLYFVP